MASTRPSRTRPRLVWLALTIPLLVVPAVAYLTLSDGGGDSRLPVAQGFAGNVFHPVVGEFGADDTTLEGCEGSYACLEQAFGNIAYLRGPESALALFSSRIESDSDVERDCHRIVHTIGSATFARFDGNVAKTFAEGSSICASGYYHGILERAFVGISTKERLAKVAGSLCIGRGIRRRSFLDYQCRHGLGHGLMIQTGYDLPTALSLCRDIGTGWDEVTCASGAFMENVSTRFGFRSPWLNEDEPLYPCTLARLPARRTCYARAATWILQVNGNDFSNLARTCESAGPDWAVFCFRGYGRDAVVEAHYRDIAKVRELCRLAGGYRADCLYGAARTFSDGSPIEGVRRAAKFCEKASSAERGKCVEGFGIVVGLLYPTDASRRAACARLAPGYVDSCTRAASAEVDPSGRRSWG